MNCLDVVFRSVPKILRTLWRWLATLLGVLLTFLLLQPAAIRGWTWTVGLWLSVLGAVWLLTLRAAWLPVLLFLAGWSLRWFVGRKPKRPARPLPYLRRR